MIMNVDISNKSLLTVEQIFKETFFKIPDYQRGYSWQQLQREELIEDIELLPRDKSHYTGTLVLHFNSTKKHEDYKGNSYNELDVVDGQQRLTSLVILLDVIRLKLQEMGQQDLADGLKESYIAIKDQNEQLLPKLKLNKDCHEFFISGLLKIQGSIDGPQVRSHQNLMNAREEFSDYLNQKQNQLNGEYLDWLKNFRKKICQKLSFTVYTVDQAMDVGVIFEVMNNRGLKLTELEKVKNYLLYLSSKLELKATHEIANYINDTWSRIFESLMKNKLCNPDNENQLLNMHWLFYMDYTQKNWKGSKSIKNEFHLREYEGKHEQLLVDLNDYLRSLRDACTVYCDIGNATGSDAFNSFKDQPEIREQIVKYSEKLRRLKVLAPFIPLLMAIRLRFPNEASLYLQAVKLCEIYSFRVYTYAGRKANAGQSSLYIIANGLYGEQVSIDKALSMVGNLALKYNPDSKFIDENSEPEDRYNWKGIKYFLYEYEEQLAGGRTVRIPWEKLEDKKAKQNSIEHILPQTPAEGYWTEQFSEDEIAICTHDIGNLTLTYDNSSYGRKAFPDKKGTPGSERPCYANSCIFMEKNVAAYDDWNYDNLIQRRKKILTWAIERWTIDIKGIASERLENQEDDDDEEDILHETD